MISSTRYNYVRSRHLEDTLPGNQRVGTWMITYNRTQFGWGQVPEREYPNFVDVEEYFGPIPAEMDERAKPGRVHHYQRIRSSRDARRIARKNPDIRSFIKQGKKWPPPGEWLELKVAFEFTRQFVESPNGEVKFPPPGTPILGTHSVPIIGMSESQRSFIFSNSWGPDWGDRGFGSMPFGFFDDYLVESWAIDERRPVFPNGNDILSFRWNVPDPLGSQIHGMELYDPREDERIAWSFAVHRDGFLDIEELFVRPLYRCRGFGSRLVAMIHDLAQEQGQPIRSWVPFADIGEENRPALVAIMSKLGLGIQRSGVRWSAYKATQDEPKALRFPIVRIPDRPAAMPDEGEELSDIETLRGSVVKYEDPFGSAVAADQWEAMD